MRRAMKSAFPHTIPILIGYVFLGFAFGVLLEQAGYHVGWAILMSVVVYSGALQFVCVRFLMLGTPLVSVFFLSALMNFRHIFYGISMLEKYRNTKKKKAYLAFALTDETFSLLNTIEVPNQMDKGWFYFSVSILHQSYWIIGSVIGSLFSNNILFNSQGIDFAMTALFVVMFIEQIQTHKHYMIGFLGIGLSLVSLFLVGQEYFIVLSLFAISATLILMRKRESL